MNARLGIVSQGWANDQARGAQAAENNAALVRSGMDMAGTVAGAYFQSNKGAGGTKLTNTGYTSQVYNEGTGTTSTYNPATSIG